jgi:hypothetical protein
MSKTHKTKRKRKSGNKYFRSATNKAIKGVIGAGVVFPLGMYAVSKGAESLGGIGAGVEAIGNIGK